LAYVLFKKTVFENQSISQKYTLWVVYRITFVKECGTYSYHLKKTLFLNWDFSSIA